MKRKNIEGENVLKKDGLTEKQLEKILLLNKKKPKPSVVRNTGSRFSFAAIADTHLCSAEERLQDLKDFYEEVKKRKVSVVVHAGDLVAGWGMYHGQENEVHTFGATNQAEYVIKNYPKVQGITTYFCNGNHDLSWWKRSGVDIGDLVSAGRSDMVYLGQYSGDIVLSGVNIRVMHPDGGGAYAISYKMQKLIEQIPSGRKPHIFIAGHYHTALYFFYRNIHAFQAGCFEGQTTFLLRKGLNPAIGGWIIDVEVGKDKKKTILSITPTFIPFIEVE